MDKGLKTALTIGGIVLAIALIVPTIIGAFTGWQGGSWGWGMMGPGMMGGYGGFGMGFMGIFWILVVGAIIWAVVAAARGTGQAGGSDFAGRSESAQEILKRRYARGEINKAEYEEKKKDLV